MQFLQIPVLNPCGKYCQCCWWKETIFKTSRVLFENSGTTLENILLLSGLFLLCVKWSFVRFILSSLKLYLLRKSECWLLQVYHKSQTLKTSFNVPLLIKTSSIVWPSKRMSFRYTYIDSALKCHWYLEEFRENPWSKAESKSQAKELV